MEIELPLRNVPFQRQVDLEVTYKGKILTCSYRADLICFDSIVIELKAIGKLGGVEEAQIINYLKATGIKVGLLINFGARSLEYRRFVF